MDKSLLIIGGTGFFGLSILDFLNNNKNNYRKIIVISKSITKKGVVKQFKNLKITHLIKDLENLNRIPKCDHILYLAKFNNYKKDISVFKKFITLLIKKKFNGNLLYTSSGAVYKQNIYSKERVLVYENYAKAKLTNEKLLKTVCSKKFKCTIARCFTYVGKFIPLDSHFVMGNIINSILKSKDIILKNRAKVIRSYMHTDDLSKKLIKLLNNSNSNFNIYNIASNDSVEIKDIALKLSKKFNLKLNVKKNSINKKDVYIPLNKKVPGIKNSFSKRKSMSAILKTINQIKTLN